MPASPDGPLRERAFAKINLTLRVLGVRPDGYHALRTVFQSIALHDLLIFDRMAGRLRIECDDPACPSGEANLVWQAAAAMWRAAKRRGAPEGVRVRIVKRIPMAAGLGGGSADAAAALRAFDRLWRVGTSRAQLGAMAARLGADVPFLLEGGTALGVDRGDVIYPLPPLPRTHIVLVVPPFGISTREAYGYWDAGGSKGAAPRGVSTSPGSGGKGEVCRRQGPSGRGGIPAVDLRNDLQAPVAARHPEIARMVRALRQAGAAYAAMTGSGSAVFGLFESAAAARRAAHRLVGSGRRVIVTATRRPTPLPV